MELEFLTSINYLAVLVAAVAYWILGALWYSPVLFAKPWQKYVQITEEDKKNMVMPMVLSFIGFFIICLGMAIFTTYMLPADMVRGLKIAILAGIVFMFVPKWINSLYGKTPATLLLIDAGYHFVGFIIAALIITAWN